MSWNKSFRPAACAASLALALCLGLGGGKANATPVSFTLDIPNSIVTVSGLLQFGSTTLAIRSQSPGSLLATLSGNLETDIVPGVSINLIGGSVVAPVLQPGGFLPSNTAADLAGKVPNILPGITAYGAFRNDVLDFTSLSTIALAGNTFSADDVVTTFLSGQFDYEVPTFISNSWGLAGGNLQNDPGFFGQLNVVGPNYQLILPLETSLVLSDSGFTLTLNVESRIVAYGPIPIVPEPSSVVLAGMAGLALVGVARHRRKAR